MLRIKPITILIMFMPITLFLLLVIYIYQRRQQFEVVFPLAQIHLPYPMNNTPNPRLSKHDPNRSKKQMT